LEKAYFRGKNFLQTKLEGAKIDNTTIFRTKFNDVDLSAVNDLDNLFSRSPSNVGYETLIYLKDSPPEVLITFLKSCSFPEAFIDYNTSILKPMKPIQFFDCFISHAGEEEDFAKRLYKDLIKKRGALLVCSRESYTLR
jgi:hypothetical protein